jgi:hypothetical protein
MNKLISRNNHNSIYEFTKKMAQRDFLPKYISYNTSSFKCAISFGCINDQAVTIDPKRAAKP